MTTFHVSYGTRTCAKLNMSSGTIEYGNSKNHIRYNNLPFYLLSSEILESLLIDNAIVIDHPYNNWPLSKVLINHYPELLV